MLLEQFLSPEQYIRSAAVRDESLVRTEFAKYNDVVAKIGKQLGTAANSVEALGRRTRAMTRKLRDVDTLPEADATAVLGIETEDLLDESEVVDEVPDAQQA